MHRQLALITVLAAGAGCTSREYEDVPPTGIEWTRAAELASGLGALLYDGAKGGGTPAQAASAAATDVTMRLGACATATVAEGDVTYKFDECGGPFGLVSLTGAIRVHYEQADPSMSVNPDYVTLTMNGAGIRIEHFTFEFSGSKLTNLLPRSYWQDPATSDPDSTVNSFELKGATRAVGPSGHTHSLESIAAVYADRALCPDDAATSPPSLTPAPLSDESFYISTGTFDADGTIWGVQIYRFARCGASCPQGWLGILNGSIHTVVGGPAAYVMFDGGAAARTYWGVDPDDHGLGDPMDEIPLACEPN